MKTKQSKYFDYGYISKDKVLQKILQTLLCQGLFLEADSLNNCETEQEIIKYSDFNLGYNKYFNNLPLKCRLFLIVNFIRGISEPQSLPESLDHNFYLTVDHLFSVLRGQIDVEIDMEDDSEDDDYKPYKYTIREHLRKCLHIIMSDDLPKKSIEIFDVKYYDHKEEMIDEEGKEVSLDTIREIWDEEVSYLQGALFGGFGTGEFVWHEERVSGCIKERPLLSQLCVNYSLFELVQQYVDIVDEYGNTDILKLKETCSKPEFYN